MSKIVVVAEKPSAAKKMRLALLGSEGKAEGQVGGDTVRVVNLRGHLYEFVQPEAMVPPARADQMKSWDVALLPWDHSSLSWEREIRREYNPKTKKSTTDASLVSLAKSLKADLAWADERVSACDLDPTGEGNLLYWEVMHELGFSAPTYKHSRMYFTEDEVPAFKKAYAERKPMQMLTDPEFRMADTRAKFDYLSGLQMTRVASALAAQSAVLRQGRLKSVMVHAVGAQLEAVNAYVKKPFYVNKFRDENGVLYSSADEPMFEHKTEVPQTYSASAVVVDAKSEKRTAPGKLLDLAGLSAILSTKGLKPKAMMAIYQKMYEAKIVSYPRTDDKNITPEQFSIMLPLVDRIAGVVGADVRLLTHRSPRSTHVQPKGAHGANRPGVVVPGSLAELDAKFGKGAALIYQTLAKNFLAMFGEDYVYEQQKGHIEAYPAFTGIANIPKSQGYRAIFDADADDEDENVSAKGLGTRGEPIIHEGFPPKPAHPSIGWLVKWLERYDVGTGATRTNTIGEISSGGGMYLLMNEQRGKLTLTEYGQMSYLMLKGAHIGDAAVTEQLFKDMKAVADGTVNASDVLEKAADIIRHDIDVMSKNAVTMRKELNLTEQNVTKEKASGSWKGEDVSFNRVWGPNTHWDGHRFTDDEVRKLLNDEVVAFDATSKQDKPYRAIGKLGRSEFNGREFVGFSLDRDLPDPEGFQVPRMMASRPLSEEERQKLAAGERLELDGFYSPRTKKNFSAPIMVKEVNGVKKLEFDFNN